jgi:hypothetical protein
LAYDLREQDGEKVMNRRAFREAPALEAAESLLPA